MIEKTLLPLHLKEFKRVVDYYEGQKQLASHLGCTVQFINDIVLDKKPLPSLMAMRIEMMSNGKFKAIKLLREKNRCYLKAN